MDDVFVGQDFRGVLARLLQSDEANLLARGTNIKVAVDVSLIAKRNYGYEIISIEIYDDKLVATGQEEKPTKQERYVSAIKIIVKRKK